MAKIPKPKNVPEASAGKVSSKGAAPPKKVSFSFRYWEQRRNYGCDCCDPQWFIGMLEKLRDLCRISVDEFLTDGSMRDGWRYHEVDWKDKHVTLKQSDCDWVADKYLDNDKEYPFMLFHLGKAFGRVMGFWDEEWVFNVVLLDPLHNIHLSKFNGYQIRHCGPLEAHYADLLAKVDALSQGLKCETEACPAKLTAAQLCISPSPRALLVSMKDEDFALLQTAVDAGRVGSLSEVFLAGLATMID